MKPTRRARNLAFLLPVGLMFLFMPPYVSLFDRPAFLAGIPLLPAYLFTLWICGIVLAYALSRRLSPPRHRDDGDGGHA